MENITNWRYQKWINDKFDFEKESSNYKVADYISWEVYPEDIELFITVLFPRTFLYKDCVIRCEDESEKELVCQNFDLWSLKNENIHTAQGQVNMCNVADIFLNNSCNTSDRTISNLANLIKINWEYHLNNTYPNKAFVVYITGESFDTYVTFLEK